MTHTYARLVDWKRIPEIAGDRNAMAQMYRRMRVDNPEMARILWRRIRGAQRSLLNSMASNVMTKSASCGKSELPMPVPTARLL